MNRIYDILYMVIIMLGISFGIENKYDNYLCKILDGITSSFDNIFSILDSSSNFTYYSILFYINKLIYINKKH